MDIIEKARNENQDLIKDDIIELLRIENNSETFYELVKASRLMSREKFGQRGYVFTQIGINAEPCPINCGFCSMGAGHYALDGQWRKNGNDLRQEIKKLDVNGFDDLFLMTTANYPQEEFLELGKVARSMLREGQRLVANIGDFDLDLAKKLKEAGFTGAYHINRLREGIDTNATPEEREATIQAIRDAGLELYYCIEPIGPEHDYEELATEILRAKRLGIEVMAVMRRIPVKGTPLYAKGQITDLELTKIVAVANLAVKPARSMNVHEPNKMAMIAGVNQLYAEVGANPRDTDSHTEQNRGFTTRMAWDMLGEFGYYPGGEITRE